MVYSSQTHRLLRLHRLLQCLLGIPSSQNHIIPLPTLHWTQTAKYPTVGFPPWLTTEYIPFPTRYWKNTHYDDKDLSLDPNWGPKDHGYFLQHLLNSFAEENLTPPWLLTFRFESCDGVREWILRILQGEIEVYMNIALLLCRASRDAYSAITLECTNPGAVLPSSEWTDELDAGSSLAGRPYPCCPNLCPELMLFGQ
jgi:hypothetical protein